MANVQEKLFKLSGMTTSCSGETRVSGLQGMIKKQAREGNFREGQHASYAVSNHPDYSSMPDDQKLRAMEHELYYLRHEMEFLKKIINPGKDTE